MKSLRHAVASAAFFLASFLFSSVAVALHAEVVDWNAGDWRVALDTDTGAIIRLARADEAPEINWLREPGHWANEHWERDTRPESARLGGPWGIVETAQTGALSTPARASRISERAWEITYIGSTLTVVVRREIADDGSLRERYTFTNTGRLAIDLPVGAVSVVTPLFDQYPNAQISLAARCHVHVWAGGHSAWLNAQRMSGAGPNLGLVVTDGAIAAYSQRGGTINDRGVFLLHPAAMRLAPGKSTSLAWQLFWHRGWDDFFAITKRVPGFVQLRAARYTVVQGEPLEITAESGSDLSGAKLFSNGTDITASATFANGTLRANIPTTAKQAGDVSVELEHAGKRTWLRAHVSPEPLALIAKRLEFFVRNQQRNAPGDPLDGAYLAYDNATNQQVYEAKPSDHNAGRERVGMGVLAARFLPLCRDEAFRAELTASLTRYAAFVKRELQDETGQVYGTIGRKNPERRYNAPWVAQLHLSLYRVDGDAAHLRDFVRTVDAYYADRGAEFYCIGMPIREGLQALRDAGLAAECDALLKHFRAHADHILAVGGNYPTSEVNYEQSIVAPAVLLLLEVHRVTGDARYLEGARQQLAFLEAFNGRQPDHHLHEISIRHWDDYWFGKLKVYGDTFPHYWSTLTAGVFAEYGGITNDADYRRRARAILENNFSAFAPDGRASCAYVYPLTTNGQPGAAADPWANDQDWALAHWLQWRELIGK